MGLSWLLPLLLLAVAAPQLVSGDYGEILLPQGQHVCMQYNGDWGSLPSKSAPIVHVEPKLACKNITNGANLHGAVAVVVRNNCSFTEKMRAVRPFKPAAIIVINTENDAFPPGAVNASNYEEAGNVAMGMVSAPGGELLKEGDKVTLAKVTMAKFDPNVSVFFLLAVGCVVLSCIWATHEVRKRTLRPPTASGSVNRRARRTEEETLHFSPKLILGFFIVASAVIVLLYLLYKYLVYVAIGIFVIAGATGLSRCLDLLLVVLSGEPRWYVAVPLFGPTAVSSLGTIAAGFAVSIFWAVQRHSDYAWVIQDMLGVCFLVSTVQLFNLPSLKLATLLLGAFFCYDVFFVFLTPFITPHHKSVMVEAATGGGSSSESIPLVIRIPKFSVPDCSGAGQSLLGFGDVLIPSLLVSYCLRFDYFVASRSITTWCQQGVLKRYRFFITCATAYAVGLLMTFVALALSSMAQPALMYLVPCTLGSTSFVAWRSGLLRAMWRGPDALQQDAMAAGADEEDEDDDVPLLDADEEATDSDPLMS